MDTESLKERADLILKKARSNLQRLNDSAASFDESCQFTLIETIRKEIVKEIEAITEQTMEKVEEKERKKRRLLVNGEEEIWVVGFPVEGIEAKFGFGAGYMPNDRSKSIALAKHMAISKGGHYLPPNEFQYRIEKLKAQILDGRLDEFLKMKSTEIVYKLIRLDSELWERIKEW